MILQISTDISIAHTQNVDIFSAVHDYIKQIHCFDWLPVHDYFKHTNGFDLLPVHAYFKHSNGFDLLPVHYYIKHTNGFYLLPVHDYIKYTHVFDWLPFQIISNTPTASTDFSKFTIINFSPHLLLLCYYYVYYEIPIFMLLFILIHVVNCRERALYTEQKKKRIFNFSLLYLQGK